MTHTDPAHPAPTPPLAADVLLVTVTEVETRAVFAALQANGGCSPTHHHIANKVYYALGMIQGAQVWLVRSEMGTATAGGALTTVSQAIDALQPTAVIMVGIAFGVNPRRQRIGDVLVAKQLLLYDLQAVKTGDGGKMTILPRGDRPATAPSLLDRVRHGMLSWPGPRASGARVDIGLLLSGDKLVDHQGFREQLRQLAPEALGGEMEGGGLYLAASQHKVDWIVVKAICDWADGTKARNKAQRQQQAAANAAAFTFHVLGQGGFGPTARRPLHDTAAILTQLQALLRPTPAPYRATVTRMVEDYTAIFGGRAAELAVLDQWLLEDTRPFAFLHAPTGRGKTALLIHWVARVQARGDWTVVFVPISLRYQTATEVSVLGALGAALAAFHRDTAFTTYNQSPDQLRPLIADYLRRAPPAGQRLLLVLDGLDEAIGWRVGRELFPRTPDAHLRVVASAREKAGTTRAHWYAQLGWAKHHSCDLGLAGLNQAAVSDVLTRMGNPLDQVATDVDVLTEIARVSAGDPLTIRFLVEALQDGSLMPGRLVGLTEGLAAFVTDWLDELRTHSAEAHTVYALLALCAVALGPLTTEDCMDLDAADFTRGVDVQRAAAVVDRFLIGDGSAERGYVFSHPRLRELFVERVLTDRERAAVQARFVVYGSAWYADRRAPLPDYVRQFWIGHLRDAGAWDRIRQVLTEVVPNGTGSMQPWAMARYAAEGNYTGYLSDLDLLWIYSEQANDVGMAIRCALLASTLRSLSGNLPTALLVGLVTVGTPQGRWSPQAALEAIAHMPDPGQRHAALMAAFHGDPPWVSPVALLARVEAEPDPWCRAALLTALADHLPVEQQTGIYAQALVAAQAVPDAAQRATLLTTLAIKLPPGEQAAVLDQAHDAVQAVPEVVSRVALLRALADQLPPVEQAAVLSQACATAQAVPDVALRVELLTNLADALPTADQRAVLAQTRADIQAVLDVGKQIELMLALADKLPAAEQAAMLSQACNATQTLPEVGKRAGLLGALAVRLPAVEQPAVFVQACAAAQAEPETWRRAVLLADLAALLPAQAQPTALDEALTAIQSLPDAEMRVHLLMQLVDSLPTSTRSAMLAQALDAAQAVPTAWLRTIRLTAVATRLPAAAQTVALAQALDAAWTMSDVAQRTRLLIDLADTITAADQMVVLAQAREAAQTIPDAAQRTECLIALATRLSTVTAFAQAYEAAQTIPTLWKRAMLLTHLAEYLPAADQMAMHTQALAAAQADPETELRVQRLDELASKLPYMVLPLAQTEPVAEARARLLTKLAQHLPIADQASVLAQARDAAQAVPAAEVRAQLLTNLMTSLPTAERMSVQVEVLAATQAVSDAAQRVWRLITLATHLPPVEQAAVLAQARDAAQAVPQPEQRAKVLIALADQLPPVEQAAVLAQARDAAQAVPQPGQRAEVLTALLVDQLPPVEQAAILAQAYDAAQAEPKTWRRARLLIGLLVKFPVAEQPMVLTQALMDTQSVRDSWRARLLTALAPHLARHATRADFLRTLRVLAARGRPDLLSDFIALLPWLVAITTEDERAELAQAIGDVGRCWP